MEISCLYDVIDDIIKREYMCRIAQHPIGFVYIDESRDQCTE